MCPTYFAWGDHRLLVPCTSCVSSRDVCTHRVLVTAVGCALCFSVRGGGVVSRASVHDRPHHTKLVMGGCTHFCLSERERQRERDNRWGGGTGTGSSAIRETIFEWYLQPTTGTDYGIYFSCRSICSYVPVQRTRYSYTLPDTQGYTATCTCTLHLACSGNRAPHDRHVHIYQCCFVVESSFATPRPPSRATLVVRGVLGL